LTARFRVALAVAAPFAVAAPLSWPCRLSPPPPFVAAPLWSPRRFGRRAALVAAPLQLAGAS